MSAQERIAVSKSKRFDIFNRDGFTCQYCGRRPPDIILELDHMIAVANGGTNEDLNLISSCSDCNRGKSAKILGDAPPRPDADLHWLQAAQERAEIDRYLQEKKLADESVEKIILALQSTWCDCLTDAYAPSRKQCNNWLAWFSPQEIDSAIHKAINKYESSWWSRSQEQGCKNLIKYVSGILHRVRKQESGDEAP